MEDTQFQSFRYSNYLNDLFGSIEDLFHKNNLVDCTLAAEGKFLKAHKIILSASSPYFASILSEDLGSHPVFILKDIAFVDLEAILYFIYSGEINIPQCHVESFLKVAENLQIKGLCRTSSENFENSTNNSDENIDLKPNPSSSYDLEIKKEPEINLEFNSYQEGSYSSQDESVIESVSNTKTGTKKRIRTKIRKHPYTRVDAQLVVDSTNIPSASLNCFQQILENPETMTHNFKEVQEEKRPYICDCGKTYTTKGNLKKHTRFECGVEPAFTCEYCSRKFHQKGNLLTHILRKHPGISTAD